MRPLMTPVWRRDRRADAGEPSVPEAADPEDAPADLRTPRTAVNR